MIREGAVLDLEFAKRLNQACDQSGVIPEYGHGRQVYVSKRLKVTQEAVRKWFNGLARPKVTKMQELARLLEVDEAWLALGVKPELDRKEKRAHADKVEGAVYTLFGLMNMAGGACAFPGQNDPRNEYVDFYTILRGMQIAVHVSVGRETSKNVYQLIVPDQFRDVRCVGVIHLTGFNFHVIDLRTDLIDRHKQRKSGDYMLTISRKDGEYFTGGDEWPRMRSAGDLV